ncbi:NADH:ubiquinone oxidoreductase complex I intermediate-associated protein 30 [Russula ochroleuca]|uniref:NADH:ubiquinone oxidoreductase complex I intermediate-associated protein 30 n=1 Tax=Russula ochroleuca TaxID=152965 RepID=A0A9P5N3L1_9AGAM|nr:NADH:ubiquinone oxidoreductase complex I intermediate-associated protein 30 [Russula ochroleuca]
MQGAEQPSRAPLTLFALNTPEAIKDYAFGCDADVGGTSTVHFDFDDDPAHTPPPRPGTGSNTGSSSNKLGAVRFHGDMRLAVRPSYEQNIRGGYAGFRNKFRPTLFGELTDDVSNHRFLALRVRAAGHPRTRGSYFVNIQTEGPTNDDLWQHRLYFTRDDGVWEDVFIPFDAFVMTKAGTINTQPVRMLRERVRSVGISLLGGNSGVEGPYELGIDEIRAVNEEDVTVEPSM